MSRKPPKPAILRTPMVEGIGRRLDQQMSERMSAVYQHYGVDENASGAKEQLIKLMAKELFPSAFKRVPPW